MILLAFSIDLSFFQFSDFPQRSNSDRSFEFPSSSQSELFARFVTNFLNIGGIRFFPIWYQGSLYGSYGVIEWDFRKYVG